MKLTLISVVSTFLCATGVAVVSSYTIRPCCQSKPGIEQRAKETAKRISRHGWIPEYKAKNRHSSAIKKTTTAKVVTKEVKIPKWVQNPIYPSFTNALALLKGDIADLAKDGDVELDYGFALTLKGGNPYLLYPAAYTNVAIGGLAFGDAVKGGCFGVSRKTVEGTNEQQMDGIGLSMHRRLDEPEFYCTEVNYSALPATKQIDAIRMHGNLEIKNTSKAYEMVEEIGKWMKEDYDAVDLDVATPAGTLALKKFKIGNGMDVEVKVNWKKERTSEGSDAHIDISFTASDLAEESSYQRHRLGEATDAARASTLNETGVNYFTVKPKVDEDAVAKKVVY